MESKKRKNGNTAISMDKRPKVHAQRKFAQGQGILPSPLKKPSNGQQSSGSSTASGPTTKKPLSMPDNMQASKKGECPKTEDFLTFLCLRGTSLCPPEFDVFNKVTIPPSKPSSADEDSDGQPEKKPQPPKRKATVPQKALPESLKALKKKYTEQRLNNAIQKSKNTASESARQHHKIVTRQKVSKDAPMVLRAGLRGAARRTRSSGRQALKSVVVKAKSTSRAAAIVAKKRKMAVLAASNNSNRMLTRLTPRGTSSAAFVRKAKKMPLEGRSLRGRDISVSSEEEEEDEGGNKSQGFKGRKMVCRKTASNVQRDSDDSDEESEEDLESSGGKKRRPARKTKEAATVYLNMLGQKMSKKSKDDDDISIESLSEATQGKRMEETRKKVKYKEKKIITPCLIKKKISKDSSASESSREGTSTATPAANKDEDSEKIKKEKKSKPKDFLKEMQDRLLEEAKKKIASTPEASPLIQPAAKTESDKSEENSNDSSRITISQRTGYIQVKPRTSSIDQEQSSDITKRRLSNDNSNRMSTPPRKILPKEPVTSANVTTPAGQHLPVGVVGAAMSNTRPTVVTTPVKSEPVPLSQPLLINTNPNLRPTLQHQPHPQQNIISAIRMPAMPMQNIQIRPTGIPIIMPQIALPNGSILQPVQPTTTALLRPPFPHYGGQMVTSFPHTVMQQRPPMMMQPTSTKCTTDVTHANTQPMVSPGPPLLSPQQQQQLLQQGAVPFPTAAPTKHVTTTAPPVLAPAGLPVTSGAVIRSVLPPKTQFSKMPNVGASSSSPMQMSNPRMSTPQFKSGKSGAISSATTPTTPVSSKSSSSFRVENESSPYAFEPEPLEISGPYRKKESNKNESSSSKSGSSSSSKKSKTPKPTLQDFDLKDIDSSIPLPPELVSQLTAQAQSDKNEGKTNETTYFIPLQNSSSGQSFGVAVKLGTEGPPGPDQKVIMKAKLVTQPVGKPLGATVIKPSSKKQPQQKKPEKPKESQKQKKKARESSSSESSSDSSSEEEEVTPKKKAKKSSPQTSKATKKSPTSNKKETATIVQLPVTSPTISSRSQETSLGIVENLDKFPKLGQHAHLCEAPIFKPTEAEFKDPIKYIQGIRKIAEPFGMCKIIPPSSFKPECNVDDDMRFTAYNQYVHKLMNRWGPNSKEMAAIKKYLDTQNVTINASNHPCVSGVEIDLPALYHAVQSLGGLTEVIQKKKWGKIAEFLRVPKGTQDRSNKFYDIYCKFLLPYDTLSKVEREELLRLVDEEFEEKLKEKTEGADEDKDSSDEEEDEEEDDEDDECVLKGKSTSLSAYFRVARNMMSMVFKDKFEANPGGDQQPELRDVEDEFWRLVQERDCHMQVQQGSIDTGSGSDGYGFPTSRNSSCGRHPWNLKILSNNRRSLLRTMGPVMGVTIPTLHVGMLFTTACWYRDPHGLPWIEYHHTGAPKIWFGIPDSHSIAFYTAMKQMAPNFCRKKKIWLTQDTVMMPPNLLVKHGVSVSRCIQEEGQFIVVFPKAYSSTINTGYSVSESVYYATNDYLKIAREEFENIRDSRDPMLFPMPKLLLCIASDDKSSNSTLKIIKPLLEKMRDNEYVKRTMIQDLGVKGTERLALKNKKSQQEEDEYECETCSANLYVSFVCDVKEDQYYCLDCAVKYLQSKKASQRKHCKLLYTHSKEEISSIIKDVNKRLDDDSDDSSDSDSDTEIKTKRISELSKEQQKKKTTPENVPKVSSPPPANSGSRPKLAGPNVPPGTSINVSSFSLVKHATKKALAVDKTKSGKTTKTKAEPDTSEEDDDDEDDDDDNDENTSEEDSEDSEVQISREAIKKAQKIKEKEKSSKATSKAASSKKKPPTPPPKKSSTPKGTPKSPPPSKASSSKKSKSSKDPKPGPSSSRATRGGSSATSRGGRNNKARKASSSKTGNLASELLDMLLSTDDDSNASDSEMDSSDEAWK